MEAIKEKKSYKEFEQDSAKFKEVANDFCFKYRDILQGFTIQNNVVFHPELEQENGKAIPSFVLNPIVCGGIVDRDYDYNR